MAEVVLTTRYQRRYRSDAICAHYVRHIHAGLRAMCPEGHSAGLIRLNTGERTYVCFTCGHSYTEPDG